MEQRNDGDEMDGGDETGCSRHWRKEKEIEKKLGLTPKNKNHAQ